MIAIILNSGIGSRLNDYTKDKPKCMVEIESGETIIKYQLQLLKMCGVKQVFITTGYLNEKLMTYVNQLTNDLELSVKYVYNSTYKTTNYIKSLDNIPFIGEDILLLHGDLIFDKTVLDEIISEPGSCMVIDKSKDLPDKDFKARILNGVIKNVGVHFFDENSVAAQPLYKLVNKDWIIWKEKIHEFCKNGNDKVYAEEALNQVTNIIHLKPIDIGGKLCTEVDNEEDLIKVRITLRGKTNDKESVYCN